MAGFPPVVFGANLFRSNILTRNLAALGIIEPEWGIFSRSGKSVVTADNVVSVEYRREWNISDYPQERGAFESYNKVETPFLIQIEFTAGGSLSNREALLKSIDAIAGNLKLYDVVTPERTYTKVNIERVNYSRRDGRAGLLMVGVSLKEIRETSATELSQTKSASGSETKEGGQVQPAEVPAPKVATVGSAVNNT